ncbi:MAG: biotin transporter BioY [Lachnospiraceae bacterium]|nr:biotin transporter BioY [Lachnospiraceae bacterium]
MRTITYTALMAALCCILGPWSIPIGPVPISLGLIGVFLSAYLLGSKRGTLAVAIYIALGAVGLPVFTGFAGGFAKVSGPTGGYIVGYLIAAFVTGLAVDHFSTNQWYISVLSMIIGLAGCYLLGTIWFCLQSGMAPLEALSVCVFPFIPFDLIKIGLCTILGITIKKTLQAADLL